MQRIAIVAVWVLASGCSTIAMQPVSATWTASEKPRCSAGIGYPVWDALMAAGSATVAVVAYESGQMNEEHYTKIVAAAGITSALYGLSAIHGLVRRSRCTGAHEEYARTAALNAPP